MVDRRVPAVVLPAIAGIARGELLHQSVARDLRDDRGRGDGEALGVALHDLGMPARGEGRVDDLASVDEHVVVVADLAERALHRDVARVIDVQPVDLGDRGGPDADARHARADLRDELLALLTGEKLRVADRADDANVRGDEARGRDDRTREGGHADLIDAHDADESLSPEGFLVVEASHAVDYRGRDRAPDA